MQFAKEMKKIITPLMSEYGFALTDSATKWFNYRNNDDSQRIEIDVAPYSLANLRVSFSFRGRYGKFEHFDIEQIIPSLSGELDFCTHEELETKLYVISDALKSNAMNVLCHLSNNYVHRDSVLFELLSADPQKRAISFAHLHGMPVLYEERCIVKVEQILDELRGDELHERRHNFQKNLNHIVDIIAYYGEARRHIDKSRSKWIWNNMRNIFYIQYSYEKGAIYPVDDIIRHWDFTPFIPAYRLYNPALL